LEPAEGRTDKKGKKSRKVAKAEATILPDDDVEEAAEPDDSGVADKSTRSRKHRAAEKSEPAEPTTINVGVGEDDDLREAIQVDAGGQRRIQHLRERHAAELKALVSRHESEAVMMDGAGEGTLTQTRKQAELTKLQERQLAETIALGAALAPHGSPEASAQRARGELHDAVAHGAGRELPRETMEYLREVGQAHPQLAAALDRVSKLSRQLKELDRPQSKGWASHKEDRLEQERVAGKIRGLLQVRGSEAAEGEGEIQHATPITEEELQTLREMSKIFKLRERRVEAAQSMLTAAAEEGDEEQVEAMSQIGIQLTRDKEARINASNELDRLILRGEPGEPAPDLTPADVKQVRKILVQLEKSQDEEAERTVQLDKLNAEIKRSRLQRLREAKASLEKLRREAEASLYDEGMSLPTPPSAGALDDTSIAVDWPAVPRATLYHLEWRECGSADWQSSEGSKRLAVPCCTKAGLQPNVEYQFRVRAQGAKGRWGQFSRASEPVSPSELPPTIPSRPLASPLKGGRIRVCWSPPETGGAIAYEIAWKKCEDSWPTWEACQSHICDDTEFVTPALELYAFYVFRVRASGKVNKKGINVWNDYGPVSPPVQAVKDPADDALKIAKKAKARAEKKRGAPDDADSTIGATESVIEARVRNAAASLPQAAQQQAQAKLRALAEHKEREERVVKELEDKHVKLAKDAETSNRRDLSEVVDRIERARRGHRTQQQDGDEMDLAYSQLGPHPYGSNPVHALD